MSKQASETSGPTPEMSVAVDFERRIFTIAGIKYSYSLFEVLGTGAIGTVIRIESREDGLVTLSKHEPPYDSLREGA